MSFKEFLETELSESTRVEISKSEYDKLHQQHVDQERKTPYGNHANSSHIYQDKSGNVVHQTYAHKSHTHLTSIEHTPSTGKYHKLVRDTK